MKVLLLSRYSELGASSRYRFYQYLPVLQRSGFEIYTCPLFDDAYLRDLYAGRARSPYRIAMAYLRRMVEASQHGAFDLVLMEYEALPWLPAWLEGALLSRRVPLVIDYDDAIFHRYDQHPSPWVRRLLGSKIDHLMHRAALTIVGNEYLAKRARNAGAKRVEILPTVVDLERYPLQEPSREGRFTVGWIGSPSTAGYLQTIHEALREVCQDSQVRVVTIGAPELTLEGVTLEPRPWVEASEVADLQRCDVGIMPLADTPWENGKCGLKLIQYMACARPVVASPVGVNREIVAEGINGFLATSKEQWVEALQKLQGDAQLRHRMGAAGRARVEQQYCLQRTAPRLAELLQEAKAGSDVRY